MYTYKRINDVEFDHVFTITDDGSIVDGPSNLYAPDFHECTILSDAWTEFSYGYTGQYGVASPMHNSEFVGGRLERDILDTPGTYVAVVCYWEPTEEDEEDPEFDADNYDGIEGWAVLRLKD